MAKKKHPAKITAEQALSVIETHIENRKKRAHTLEGGGFGMMGCDMDFKTIKQQLKEAEDIALSGPNMEGMGHGIGYLPKGKDNYLFISTNREKLIALHHEQGFTNKK